MLKRIIVLVVLTALLSVIVLLITTKTDTKSQTETPASVSTSIEASETAAKPPPATASEAQVLSNEPADSAEAATEYAPLPYSQEFHTATNLHQLTKDLHEKAISGDVHAQYYLGKALQQCESAHRFKPYRNRELFREFLSSSSMQGSPAEQIALTRRNFKRCEGFIDDSLGSFGTGREWLQRAALQGLPAARLAISLNELIELSRTQYKPLDTLDYSPKRRQELGELVISAIKDGGAEVLFESGIAGLGSEHYSDEVFGAATLLAACRTGHPCGTETHWLQGWCAWTACSRVTNGEDLISEHLSAIAFHDTMQLTALIVRARETGDWSEVGLEFRVDEE